MVQLTGKQKRYLRSLGHHLQPAVTVGAGGIGTGVIGELIQSLSVHELVKVKVGQGCSVPREELAESLAGAAECTVAQILGKTILLYRPAKKPKIRLPE